MRVYCIILISLCTCACTKETPSPARSSSGTVHLAGEVETPEKIMVGSYWKNGKYFPLTDGTSASEAYCMAVSDSNVWIGGWDWSLLPNIGVVWKNKQQTSAHYWGEVSGLAALGTDFYTFYVDLQEFPGHWVYTKNGITNVISDTARSISPTAIALWGNEVFLSGCSSLIHSSNDVIAELHAQCWKNGMLIFREAKQSSAVSIYATQNDIYMCGFLRSQGDSSGTACYWKNNELIPLTGTNSIALSIFVEGIDVLVAGWDDYKAVYWKNGIKIPLTDGTKISSANSIFVNGSDVYIGGHEDYHPSYWKNNVKQSISNQDLPGQIKSVVVQ